MSQRVRLAHAIVAGLGVFLVDVWPLLLIWRAGASGSVGDLSEVRFVGVGFVYSLGLAVLSGRWMAVALRRAERSPELGRLDPWGAYALAIGVYNLALTAVPALIYGLLLTDENASLRNRSWLVYLLWVGGHVGAAVVAALTARGFLGRRLVRSPSVVNPPEAVDSIR
jgi:hypothetical protein